MFFWYDAYMNETFSDMLLVGGKSNSLGRVNEIIAIVLGDKSRMDELYAGMFHPDAWGRMRAADAFEKICRVHPDWILPYINRFTDELTQSTQPSIQWHLAQIYAQVELTPEQKRFAVDWLARLLSNKDADWIVAANAMDTLVGFTHDGSFSRTDFVALLKIQQHHKSKAVVKRANKYLDTFSTP